MAPPQSFFMFCSPADFTTRLSVPRAFVENHKLHRRRGLTLRLKTAPAGRSWAVKIKEIDGVFYITNDGWFKFVANNGLLQAKLLFFHIVGDSTLHVSIYGLDACLELPPSPSSALQEKRPSFYKILLGISPELRLPDGFVRKHGALFPREVKLRNGYGGTWEVKIEEVDDDGYFFTGGWTEFCGDMGLEVFELLLFTYAGDATFDVSFYAVTALEKVTDDCDVFDNPRCRVELKNHHYLKFHVPAAFAKESGLKEKKKVLFEYSPDGHSGEVKLNVSNGRVALGSGWARFFKANKLTHGKTYVLEFIRTRNVIRFRPCR